MSGIKTVAIIGGGCSGLAAAIRLQQARPDAIQITLFEERSSFGGRTRSFVDPHTGDTIDNGQHLLMGCYTATLEYLKRIGSRHLLHSSDSLEIPFFQKDHGYAGSLETLSWLPAPFHLLAALLSTSLLAPYEKAAAVRFGQSIRSMEPSRLDPTLTCGQLFAQYQQPDSIVRKLWEPIILATLNMPVQAASARIFVTVMKTVFFTSTEFSKILFPTIGLGDLLIAPAIDHLRSNGACLQESVKIQGLQKTGSGYTLYPKDGDALSFDAVIIAASPIPDWLEAIVPISKGAFEFSPIVNLYLWVDSVLFKHPINAILGTHLQWCFPKRSHYAQQLIACTISAADALVEMEPEQVVSLIEDELRSVLPHSSFSIIHSLVLKEKRATYRLLPAIQQQRPPVQLPGHRIALAGDLPQNDLPFTIEGAIRNGQHAAEIILNSI